MSDEYQIEVSRTGSWPTSWHAKITRQGSDDKSSSYVGSVEAMSKSAASEKAREAVRTIHREGFTP